VAVQCNQEIVERVIQLQQSDMRLEAQVYVRRASAHRSSTLIAGFASLSKA